MKRIVLYGPPLAGKTTLLNAIAQKGPVERVVVVSLDDDLTCRGARTELTRASSKFELVTLCGPTQTDGIRRSILRDTAAVVLVLDGQREREEANRAWMVDLANHAPVMGCIVVTKLDLPNATFEPAWWEGTRFANWPAARSRRRDTTGAVDAVEALIRGL